MMPGSRSDMWRCRLELPYPQQVTVYGEGINKKEAEKRCSVAACLKLLVRREDESIGKGEGRREGGREGRCRGSGN